ncbi:cationic amino acid transporter 2-like [Diaphorina citri]|uniref:Cationic amino acid transporter 2-like n=2 Tax=Diaphorina citri TaxID=121845 RepID=A0A3Q0IKG2_DIACI|nr:cationic amino acid transporter 2-like [Diaphorina citri]
MYSYVTVGEFIAFVIGWNMVLEYLIGTSACACALSACFDTLTHGAISSSIKTSFGTIFGRPPDFLAFLITILMMILLAAGVRKSLLFNNVLNTINLAAWVFIMSAGLFYINTDNWNLHGGFLPRGWSGVFTGAATCFYAFIGFDIIATTGEEAHNPKRSIPLAILISLCIILAAYVTSSMILTLVGTLLAYTLVSTCVLILRYQPGSTNLMDLLPESLKTPIKGSPSKEYIANGQVCQTFLVALDLGSTLLAYTLVSTCVLILRYQPGSTNLMDLLPESLKTPIKGSPSKEYIANGQYPEQLKSSLKDIQPRPPPSPENPTDFQSDTLLQQQKQRIMVRRVTRSSPDSDDTYAEESEECSMRDDQYLVSDRIEGKFYGSVHGTGTAGGTSSNPLNIGPSLEQIQRKIHAATYLCPAIFPWVDTGPPTEESGILVIKLVGVLYVLIILLDVTMKLFLGSMGSITQFIVYAFIFAIIGILLVISRKPQNKKILMFKTPCVPFVPVIAITVNIYLILKLHYLTLIPELLSLDLDSNLAATYLCPAIFPWVDTGPPTEESGILVIKLVGVLYVLIILLDVTMKLFLGSMGSITQFIVYAFIFAIIGILLVISRKPQNKKILMFKTPCVPFVPVIAITVNIYLILKLHYLTLIRFTIWMTLGFIMYFYYGIKHSTLEEGSDNIELEATVVNSQIKVPKKAPAKENFEQYDMTEYDKRPTASSEPKTSYSKEDLFVPASAFPTWDD